MARSDGLPAEEALAIVPVPAVPLSCWSSPMCQPNSLVSGEKGDICGIGTSFIKMFQGSFMNASFIPSGYSVHDALHRRNWFTVTTAPGRSYRILLEQYNDRVVFTKGWNDLATCERIEQGDVGFFKRTGSEEFSMVLHDNRGVVKPGIKDGCAIEQPRRGIPWEMVKYELSPRTSTTQPLVNTLYAVWVATKSPTVLYGITMKHNHVIRGILSFTKRFSDNFAIADEELPIALFFNGSAMLVPGEVTTRSDRLVRLTSGWSEFVRTHGIKMNSTYVIRLGYCTHGWQLTVYQV